MLKRTNVDASGLLINVAKHPCGESFPFFSEWVVILHCGLMFVTRQ